MILCMYLQSMCFIALRPDFNRTLTQICNIVCLGIRSHSLHLTLFGRCLSCNLPRKVWCPPVGWQRITFLFYLSVICSGLTGVINLKSKNAE